MNILFLTIGRLRRIRDHAIYPDLLRSFLAEGHRVYAVSANEKRVGEPTTLTTEDNAFVLQVRTGNLMQCGLLEKGISTLRLQGQYRRAIDRFFPGVKFDLILYSTPPITLSRLIAHYKKRDAARSFCLLKDIYPQNALDLGILSRRGWKGIATRWFLRQEKRLYALSDGIGCMSEGNVRYLHAHHPEISGDRLTVCPNCIELRDTRLSAQEKREMRQRYGLPQDRTVFLYGGNLGHPQGIPFVIECLRKTAADPDAFFLIIGSGAYAPALREFLERDKPGNVMLLNELPKEEYDHLAAACDVGLIFLDHRFTIPNFPSRLLIYLQAGLPVLAVTDPVTDLRDAIRDGDLGKWCESDDADAFAALVRELCESDLTAYAPRVREYVQTHYSAQTACRAITDFLGAR